MMPPAILNWGTYWHLKTHKGEFCLGKLFEERELPSISSRHFGKSMCVFAYSLTHLKLDVFWDVNQHPK
ncbi:hypothetical protein XELAEV_18037850mg [Xenopus laevis]|uniref:Uncharacterized protein n=1 Tax=Xenopus laevis TaxID=8355 RepID=A0A974HB03_XENLA|nr:hypothetical protein XELAEV_18037850mg [Xenopus laevis]